MPLITEKICQADAALLMLDYDGTLTPIVPNYETAQISESGLHLLAELTHILTLQPAIVSGRSVSHLLAFLKDLIGQPLYLVGLHGGEMYNLATQTYVFEPPLEYRDGVTRLKMFLYNHGIEQLPGIQLEDKGYSLGVHYRLSDEATAEKALALLHQGFASERLQMDFILRPGKKLLEAVPQGFNKGIGVTRLMNIAQTRFGTKPLSVYLGDDITDFDAFEVVNAHDGISIYVGPCPPADAPPVADCLPDVDAVHAFLASLVTAFSTSAGHSPGTSSINRRLP